MGIQESLAKRRTYYNINKELPVAEADVIALVENTTELCPIASLAGEPALFRCPMR